MELFAGKLAVLPLFRGLSPLQLVGIARRAERVAYNPGAFIIEDAAVADAAILIVSGSAVRVSGPGVDPPGESVTEGSLLGEAAMLVETTFGSTIVARTAVRSVHITRDSLHAQMLEDPGIADCLMRNLAHRLSSFANRLRRADELLGCPSLTAKPTRIIPARSAHR